MRCMLSTLFIYIILHYFKFLTITFETYNNKVSNLVTKILFSSENSRKLINGGGGLNKSGGPRLLGALRVSNRNKSGYLLCK